MVGDSFIPQIEPWIDEKELHEVEKVIKSTFITENKATDEFEKLIGEFTGAKHAIAYMNGSVALWGCLHALDIGPGDEVIVPDLTFVATVNAVLLAGAKPIFCDIDPETLQVNVELIERKISNATKAIIPVHLYGNAASMPEIMELARNKGLFVIEDGAEALGTTINGKHINTFGELGILSFYGNKNMTTAEGGMILTNNDDYARKCRQFKNCGRDEKGTFIHKEIGHNFRISDVHSAIGLAQFKKFPEIMRRKKANYEKYQEVMPNIKFYEASKDVEVMPWLVNIRVENPGELAEYLKENNIGTRRLFSPMHMQPCYEGSGFFEGEFPGSIDAYEHGLSLPSSATLTEEEIEYISSKIKEFYKDKFKE